MDYDKLTKAELIDKLNEQKHLAHAVEVKDQEIIRINNELQKTRSELNQKASMISKEEVDKMLNNALADAEKTVQLANEFLAANKNALTLMNAALTVINQNDKLLNEKLGGNN
jgi:hypothetical protein